LGRGISIPRHLLENGSGCIRISDFRLYLALVSQPNGKTKTFWCFRKGGAEISKEHARFDFRIGFRFENSGPGEDRALFIEHGRYRLRHLRIVFVAGAKQLRLFSRRWVQTSAETPRLQKKAIWPGRFTAKIMRKAIAPNGTLHVLLYPFLWGPNFRFVTFRKLYLLIRLVGHRAPSK